MNFQTKISDGAANTEKIGEGNLEEGDGDGSNGAGAQQSPEEVHSLQQGKATTFLRNWQILRQIALRFQSALISKMNSAVLEGKVAIKNLKVTFE